MGDAKVRVRCVVLVAALVAAGALSSCDGGGRDGSAAGSSPAPVMYGDSLSWEAGDFLRLLWHAETGQALRLRAVGGLAVCDWVETIRADLARADRPRMILLQAYGNNVTACARFEAGSSGHLRAYGSAFDEVRALAERAGVRVVWVMSPPRHPAEAAPELPATLADMARRRGWKVIDPSAAVAGPHGEWVRMLRCLPHERAHRSCVDGHIEVRDADTVHFGGVAGGYRSGAFRWAAATVDLLT